MKLVTLLTLAQKVIAKRAEENPEGGFKTPEGRISFTEARDELENLKNWVSPSVDGSNTVRVVRCCDCHYHKKGDRIHSIRRNPLKHCSTLNIDTQDDFFCKQGMKKWEEDE